MEWYTAKPGPVAAALDRSELPQPPLVVILRGVPGSGKSHFSQLLIDASAPGTVKRCRFV